jgi:transcriptional regulator with XRE-family HTH domain
MLRAADNFKNAVYRAGLSMEQLAEKAGLKRATVYAWINPKHQARGIGIRLKNAWEVARVYAQVEGVSRDEAFKQLFVEVPDEQPVTT